MPNGQRSESGTGVSGFFYPGFGRTGKVFWRTFLENHMFNTFAIDFFTVPTATFEILYVFVIIYHESRKVVHFDVTRHPTARWTAQQIVEACP